MAYELLEKAAGITTQQGALEMKNLYLRIGEYGKLVMKKRTILTLQRQQI